MSSHSQHVHAIILAAPRSGTTWLSAALNHHPALYCTEGRFFGNHADFVQDMGVPNPRLRITLDKYIDAALQHHFLPDTDPQPVREHLERQIIELFVREGLRISGKTHFVDKITPHLRSATTVAASIRTYCPRAKIIYLQRDGRDVLTSGVFHWLNKHKVNHPPSLFQQHRNACLRVPGRATELSHIFTLDEIDDWAERWTQPAKIAAELGATHPVLRIRYEDMLAHHPSVLLPLFQFLEVEATADLARECARLTSFSRMKKDPSPAAHVREGSTGQWRQYFTRGDALRFLRRTGKQLVEQGYAPDSLWWQPLPEALSEARAA